MKSHSHIYFVIVCIVIATVVFVSRGRAEPAMSTASAGSAPPRIAVCNVIAIVNELISSERYKNERDALAKDLSPLYDILMSQRDQLLATPLNPDTQYEPESLRHSISLLNVEGTIARETDRIYEEKGQLFRKQQAESYRKAVGMAIKVGKELGYTHVLQSETHPEVIEAQSTTLDQFTDILGRIAILAPAGDDITEIVRKRLDNK